MSSSRLPSVIGPTENSLRALLREILSATEIGGYEEWVYLNLADGADDGDRVDELVTDALKRPGAVIAATRTRLADAGLLDPTGSLSQAGREQLRSGRELVSQATMALTAGIDPTTLRTTIDTLAVVRGRAERGLEDRLGTQAEPTA